MLIQNTIDNPLEHSAFQWTSFCKDFFNEGKSFPREKSEYRTPKEAVDRMKVEDGERAFDTGQIMQKFIFGIYGTKHAKDGWKITAAKFDSKGKNLLGCATIKDWEWVEYTELGDRVEFTEENVLEYLNWEVAALTEFLNEE
jgi:hypothetical protein